MEPGHVPDKHQTQKLIVAQRNMERAMLSVTKKDKIRNWVIGSRTGAKAVNQSAEQASASEQIISPVNQEGGKQSHRVDPKRKEEKERKV